jgi:hypothetical protein
MNPELRTKFLTNTDDTGRFIVYSNRTGKTYACEPIDNRSKTDWTEWGSIDPATGEMMNKPGFRKYAGAIDASESLITEANGFKNVEVLEPGMSPHAYIDFLDSKYPDKV